MKRLLAAMVMAGSLAGLQSFASPGLGDTQGTVQAVVVDHSYLRDYDSFLVYFTNVENDRWSCIATNGFIRVKSNGMGVTDGNFKQLFSVALTAQLAGKRLALSSSGTSPCDNVNGAWMID